MIVYFLLLVIVVLFLGYREKRNNEYCRSNRRLEGRTTLVTGGTSGMGLEIATDLADRGARVIVACPFVEEGERALKIIVKKSDNENVVFKFLDLQSMESVRIFAKDILESEERLDILMNNAGTGFGDQLLTKDGYNFTMAVNYYGAFLLTMLLLPLLRKSGTPEEPAKILNTASILHYVGILDFDNMNKLNYWSALRLYCNSKLCLSMFTVELAKRLKGQNVIVNTVDPGVVGTPIFNTYCGKLGIVATLVANYLAKTSWQGAQTALHAALDKEASKTTGEYFKNCSVRRAKEIAYDDDVRVKLWKDTVRLVNLEESDVQRLLHGAMN
ncbi:retinol dehydrogenase 12-like [Aricia agestis]|uniref:retinol dehydrogenase 12-like n=1 Tax=Aricia agestis TaxID=91739 RepID=UPI001C201B3A|nr:retinol dehydrogenase 12-like [Aricia agestis]